MKAFNFVKKDWLCCMFLAKISFDLMDMSDDISCSWSEVSCLLVLRTLPPSSTKKAVLQLAARVRARAEATRRCCSCCASAAAALELRSTKKARLRWLLERDPCQDLVQTCKRCMTLRCCTVHRRGALFSCRKPILALWQMLNHKTFTEM